MTLINKNVKGMSSSASLKMLCLLDIFSTPLKLMNKVYLYSLTPYVSITYQALKSLRYWFIELI